MNQIQPHPFDPNQMADSINNVAAGAAVLSLLMMLLSVIMMIYFFIMPLLIYVRLGRIARAVESTDYTQKNILVALKEFVALQQKVDANASVQTTILKNLDQNLALGVNKAMK